VRLGLDQDITRLGTTLTKGLISHFAQRKDLSGLLDAGFQDTLKEAPPLIQRIVGQSTVSMPEDPFDRSNPIGRQV
jgi:hypothetical protein